MELENDGLGEGQEIETSEAGQNSDSEGVAPIDTRYEDLSAKVDLMLDSMTALQSSMRPVAQQQTLVEDSEEDDDEPITGSRVKKIIRGAIGNAMSESKKESVKTMWDNKAKTEFPLSDPKFEKELRSVWGELIDSGLNPQSPKALYTAAKMAALKFQKPAQKKKTATAMTSEAPNSTTSSSTPSSKKVNMVSENDSRLKFYLMRGKKSPEQIERMRIKLAEKDMRKAR